MFPLSKELFEKCNTTGANFTGVEVSLINNFILLHTLLFFFVKLHFKQNAHVHILMSEFVIFLTIVIHFFFFFCNSYCSFKDAKLNIQQTLYSATFIVAFMWCKKVEAVCEKMLVNFYHISNCPFSF